MVIWGNDTPGSSANGPETGVDLVCFRNIRKASVDGMDGQEEQLEE